MPLLKSTKVYRGGITAPYLNFETKTCSFSTNAKDKTLDFRFDIASKGGGTTSILLQIGLDDLPEVLSSLARQFPESVGVLSDCAAIANKKNLEELKKTRDVHADEKARAKSLIEQLEPVAEFVSDRYMEKPAGEDEQEEAARSTINSVIRTLRELE